MLISWSFRFPSKCSAFRKSFVYMRDSPLSILSSILNK